MRALSQLKELGVERNPIVLAVGFFDGVHKGHQSVIAHAVHKAQSLNGQVWVLTFDPHPMKILKPECAPPLLTSTPHKLRLLQPLEIDGCVVLSFTHAFAAQEPEDFLRRLRSEIPNLVEIVVGKNWTFGFQARGNSALLKKLAPTYGFQATVVQPILWKGSPISSSRIRRDISEGRLEEAREMLGRPFTILGTVTPGQGIGRELGFPTANIDPHNEVYPPPGIYAVHAIAEGARYKGAAFLGTRQSIRNTPSGLVLEVHLLDVSPNLYGKDMEVIFVQRIREERRFSTHKELSEQIARDVADIRKRLEHDSHSL